MPHRVLVHVNLSSCNVICSLVLIPSWLLIGPFDIYIFDEQIFFQSIAGIVPGSILCYISIGVSY